MALPVVVLVVDDDPAEGLTRPEPLLTLGSEVFIAPPPERCVLAGRMVDRFPEPISLNDMMVYIDIFMMG